MKSTLMTHCGRWRVALLVGLAFAATPGLIAAQTSDTTPLKLDAASFTCIRQMTPVRNFYVGNLLGNLEGTLAAANAPKGAVFPPGTVIQLVPTEAMVKREKGFSPDTGDWEFFDINVSSKGSEIRTRGAADVVNRFGGNCLGCHAPAADPWDFVCETNHGCDPIPIDHSMTRALQHSDPRCDSEILDFADRFALLRLDALVITGQTVAWFKSLI